jgi:hypothetical protein
MLGIEALGVLSLSYLVRIRWYKAPPHFAFGSSDVAMEIACHYVADILWLWRKRFHDKNQKPTL